MKSTWGEGWRLKANTPSHICGCVKLLSWYLHTHWVIEKVSHVKSRWNSLQSMLQQQGRTIKEKENNMEGSQCIAASMIITPENIIRMDENGHFAILRSLLLVGKKKFGLRAVPGKSFLWWNNASVCPVITYSELSLFPELLAEEAGEWNQVYNISSQIRLSKVMNQSFN